MFSLEILKVYKLVEIIPFKNNKINQRWFRIATSSFCHNIVIDTPEAARSLIGALEQAEQFPHRGKIDKLTQEFNKVTADIQAIIPFFNLQDFYFAGGCLYCLWNGKEVKDYDIFCTNRAALRKLNQHFKNHPELVNCKTRNAYTVGKYQFVIRHIGEPDVEVGKFDFRHNCYWYDNQGVHSLYGWNDISSRELKFNTDRARDVLNVITRIPKFVERGMEISQKEILDILEMGTRPTKYFAERQTIKQRRRGRSKY